MRSLSDRERGWKGVTDDEFPDRQTLRRTTAVLASFSSDGQASTVSSSRPVARVKPQRAPSAAGRLPADLGGDSGTSAPIDIGTSQGWQGRAHALEVQALRDEVGHLRGLLEAVELGPADADPSRLAWAKLVGHTAQLQRQVAVLDAELQASRTVAAEAEAALLEVCGALQQLQGRCETGDVCGACTGPLQALVERQLQRMQRQTAQAADLLSGSATGNGQQPSGSWGPARGPEGAARASSWHIPYTPAGGNRFLQRHCAATTATCTGQQVPLTVPALGRQHPGLADPAQVLDLQNVLCHLGPRLAGLSVLLHTAVLPALPWVAPAIRLQFEQELQATARDVAHAAGALVELGCASAAGDAVVPRPGRPPPGAGVHGLAELPPALRSLHEEFENAVEDMKARLSAVPREQRASLKAALAAAQQLAERWLVETATMSQRSSTVLREVEWVETNVAQQAEAVWRLLYADTSTATGRGKAGLPTPELAERHLLAAAALHRVHEAAAQVASQPSEAALRDLVQCATAQLHHLDAAAQQQEHLAHTAALLQAGAVSARGKQRV